MAAFKHFPGAPRSFLSIFIVERHPSRFVKRGLALVIESPPANNVTSCPSATNSSVSHETTSSVPPYDLGGTLSANRATWAMRINPPVVTLDGLDASLPARSSRCQTASQCLWFSHYER